MLPSKHVPHVQINRRARCAAYCHSRIIPVGTTAHAAPSPTRGAAALNRHADEIGPQLAIEVFVVQCKHGHVSRRHQHCDVECIGGIIYRVVRDRIARAVRERGSCSVHPQSTATGCIAKVEDTNHQVDVAVAARRHTERWWHFRWWRKRCRRLLRQRGWPCRPAFRHLGWLCRSRRLWARRQGRPCDDHWRGW